MLPQLEESAKEGKPREVLFLSATVRDRKFSEIRWADGVHRWSAFSNMDFNLLAALGSIETADTEYSLLLAISDEPAGTDGLAKQGEADGEKAAVEGRQIPSLEKLSPTRAQYLVFEDKSGAPPSAKDLAALDALHLYYDANRQRLGDEHAKRQTANAERERWLKEHPPVPKDTVISYWKMDAAAIRASSERETK